MYIYIHTYPHSISDILEIETSLYIVELGQGKDLLAN